MKKISVAAPCYSEEENVGPMAETFASLFRYELITYDYELIFIDNDPQDRTREYFRTLCAESRKIKAISNAKNFGQFNSPCYGMSQSTGDTTMLMAVDLQDSPEMAVRYVVVWEGDHKIAIGIGTHSTENPLIYHLRSSYYKWTRKLSEMDQIEHFTDFGLYDKSFIQVLRDLGDPMPLLRGIIAGLGCRRREIPYDQPKRCVGRTNNNLYKLYGITVLSVTSYTEFGPRFVTLLGGITPVVSVVIVFIYLIIKLLYRDRPQVGLTPLSIGILLLSVVQIFFIDMAGGYVLTINQRVMKRPLVVEAKRLSFGSEDTEEA